MSEELNFLSKARSKWLAKHHDLQKSGFGLLLTELDEERVWAELETEIKADPVFRKLSPGEQTAALINARQKWKLMRSPPPFTPQFFLLPFGKR